jgi:hypothetical protein
MEACSISPEVLQFLGGLWDVGKLTLAAFFGVLTYVLGQIFMKFAEPVILLREEIGSIDGDLMMYGNESTRIASDDERMKIYRRHAAKLYELVARIPHYDPYAKIFRLPPRNDVIDASGNLTNLSNMQGQTVQLPYVLGKWQTTIYIKHLLGTCRLNDKQRESLRRQGVNV